MGLTEYLFQNQNQESEPEPEPERAIAEYYRDNKEKLLRLAASRAFAMKYSCQLK